MNKVRALRKDRGWTIAELARRSGVKRSTLVKIEVNVNNGFNFQTGLALAEALEVEPKELVEVTE